MSRSIRVEVADGCITVEADGFTFVELARLLGTMDDGWTAKRVAALVPRTGAAPVVEPAPVVWTCDVCSQKCASERGLAVHKGQMHKKDKPAPKPTPLKAVPRVEPNGNGHRDGERLFCDECKFSADRLDFAKLRQHTMSQHEGRLPTELERIPRTAAERKS